MSDKDVFTVSDKLVKLRDGESYDLANYVEGTDYVRRAIRYGTKVVFKKGFLGEDEPQLLAELEQPESQPELEDEQPESRPVQRAILELDDKGMRIVLVDPTPEDWRASTPNCEEIEQPQTSGHNVKTAKVRRIHVNNRWIETDIGRIWAGAKGGNLKVGQIIRVLNGELFLGKTEPSGSFVRI